MLDRAHVYTRQKIVWDEAHCVLNYIIYSCHIYFAANESGTFLKAKTLHIFSSNFM